VYRKQYFEGGFSSVYFFETEERDEKSFGACFLIHKDVVDKGKGLDKGWWDSIHVFEVTPDKKNTFNYKLTTTVMVSMALKDDKVGLVDLSGSMTKQDERRQTVEEKEGQTHIMNLGVMIEDMELRIRNAIEGIYIQKTREVVNGMRSPSAAKEKLWAEVASALTSLNKKDKDDA